LSTYAEFLSSKSFAVDHAGLEVDRALLNPSLFDFQRDLTAWSLRKGRSALFCDCGLGKTVMQLDWAKHVPGKVLILAPLAVSQQTVREGEKFGIEVVYSRRPVSERITITNYEMLEHFNPSDYAGIVLDESSILKSYSGKVRNQIISAFRAFALSPGLYRDSIP
jgi:superfamily II DNA or RNA helicase